MHGTLAAKPHPSTKSALYNSALVIAGSLLVALSAQVSIPLWFTPVPITGQTFGVLLVGAVLGSRRGALALCAYLLQGAAGLPVFAEFRGGLPVLLGPTGGYLFGFVFAAALVGWLAEKGWDHRFVSAFAAMALGNVVVFGFGVPWLAQFVSPNQALALGLWPFLPGALVKTVLAAAVLPAGRRLFGR